MRLLRSLAFALFIASPALAQNSDPALSARFKEFVAATKGKDATKLADFYTDDAVLFDASGVRKGRAGVLDYFRPEALKNFATMSSVLTDARSSGDLGYTFGTFAYPASGSQKPRTGSFMLVWRRVGNQWRIAYDTFTTDPKPVPPK
jgi:ketosteroid isomerase-like protein